MSAYCEYPGCGVACRGRCGRCEARLCYQHKPSSPRKYCAVCASGAHTRASSVAGHRSVPVYVPPIRRKPFDDMTFDEQLLYIGDLRGRIEAMKQAQRDYLDRRAARGTHTLTDDAYEGYQVLEAELLEFLQATEMHMKGEA